MNREGLGGNGMRSIARRFSLLSALLAVFFMASAADAASMARQCRLACADEIAACVAAGGRDRACKKQTIRRCRREGLAVCQGVEAGRGDRLIGQARRTQVG